MSAPIENFQPKVGERRWFECRPRAANRFDEKSVTAASSLADSGRILCHRPALVDVAALFFRIFFITCKRFARDWHESLWPAASFEAACRCSLLWHKLVRLYKNQTDWKKLATSQHTGSFFFFWNKKRRSHPKRIFLFCLSAERAAVEQDKKSLGFQSDSSLALVYGRDLDELGAQRPTHAYWTRDTHTVVRLIIKSQHWRY